MNLVNLQYNNKRRLRNSSSGNTLPNFVIGLIIGFFIFLIILVILFSIFM